VAALREVVDDGRDVLIRSVVVIIRCANDARLLRDVERSLVECDPVWRIEPIQEVLNIVGNPIAILIG
jgi:hypothetical protein